MVRFSFRPDEMRLCSENRLSENLIVLRHHENNLML